jgi:hypothetical protein
MKKKSSEKIAHKKQRHLSTPYKVGAVRASSGLRRSHHPNSFQAWNASNQIHNPAGQKNETFDTNIMTFYNLKHKSSDEHLP